MYMRYYSALAYRVSKNKCSRPFEEEPFTVSVDMLRCAPQDSQHVIRPHEYM